MRLNSGREHSLPFSNKLGKISCIVEMFQKFLQNLTNSKLRCAEHFHSKISKKDGSILMVQGMRVSIAKIQLTQMIASLRS